MNWKELSNNDASLEFEKLLNGTRNNETKLNSSYEEMRNDLLNLWKETNNEILEKKLPGDYCYDYIFALKMYNLLTNKYGITKYEAGNDNIWMYIHLIVSPEILRDRIGMDNPDRYYKLSRRLYFKNLWWYIYLSWRIDEDTTRKIIENNSTDTILQLCERSGKLGYRREVYNEIMYQKYLKKIKDGSPFRSIMVLNTLKVKTIDPYIYDGGVEKYVQDLIKEALEG
ncbi:MAG: hypothetical protein IKD74_06620 [Clostridia bacterium]|nr:hypothetical protein [Clostridia bacterium]